MWEFEGGMRISRSNSIGRQPRLCSRWSVTCPKFVYFNATTEPRSFDTAVSIYNALHCVFLAGLRVGGYTLRDLRL